MNCSGEMGNASRLSFGITQSSCEVSVLLSGTNSLLAERHFRCVYGMPFRVQQIVQNCVLLVVTCSVGHSSFKLFGILSWEEWSISVGRYGIT
jgi:hypothetical protein